MQILNMYLGFKDILIYGTPVLMIFFFFVLLRGKKTRYKHHKLSSYFHHALVIQLFMYVIFSTYSLIVGYRSAYFFVLVGIMFATTVIYIVSAGRSIDKRIVLLTMLLVSFTEPLIILLGNRFYPQTNWGRDIILQTGSLEGYFKDIIESGLYYLVPINELNQVTLAIVIEPSQLIRLVLTLLKATALVLSLYVFFVRARYGVLAGLLAVFALWANPGNSFMMGRLVLEAYPLLFLLLAMIYAHGINMRGTLIVLTVITIPMVFAHGSPSVAITLLLAPLILLTSRRKAIGKLDLSKLKTPLLIMLLITMAYWSATYIMSNVANIGIKFVDGLITYFSVESSGSGEAAGWSYVPRYVMQGFEIFAYSWSFPIALAGSLALYYLVKVFKKRSFSLPLGLGESAAITGVVIAGMSYITYSIGEAGQYWIPVGYFLCMLATAVALKRALVLSNKASFVIVLLLSSLFISVGMYSPSHAPLEHPDFESGSYVLRFTRYMEAALLRPFIPNYATIYYDYDLLIGIGMYKDVRRILYLLINGEDPRQFYHEPCTLMAIKNERLLNSKISLHMIDLVYKSDYYTVMSVSP